MQNIECFYNLTNELKKTSSTTIKHRVLVNAISNNKEIVKYFNSAYDPLAQYNLTSKNAHKIYKNDAIVQEQPIFQDIEELLFSCLESLKARGATGNEAAKLYISMLIRFPEKYHKLIDCILDKDLSCGINIKTINKALTQCGIEPIKTFNVALGEKYTDQDVFNGNYFASRKLDGVRCLVIVKNNKVSSILSRSGKPFSTLGLIENELNKSISIINKIDFVLDGEISLINEHGKDDFQGIMKQISRKNHTIENCRYNIFDMIPFESFCESKCKTIFTERYIRLENLFCNINSKHLSKVQQTLVKSREQLEDLIKFATDSGWEGLILRKNCEYKGKRSNDILKVKKMQDAEYKVVGVEQGIITILDKNKEQKQVETMGSAIIEYKGNIVKVGSGWSFEQRQKYFENPQEIIGKTITVQYFEETKDKYGKYSLRFPVVKHVYGKERLL